MNTPARLAKKPDVENDFEVKLNQYAHIIVPICLIMLVVLIIMVIAVMAGHVSATESGVLYNHLKDVI